jgi:hypothetical protein
MADRYWQTPSPGATPSLQPSAALIAAATGRLMRVIPLSIHQEHADLRLELLALELYDTGALLSFRSTVPAFAVMDPQRLANERAWLTWRTSISDGRGTLYETMSGGNGNSQLWRGEVLIFPTPPADVRAVSVQLYCAGDASDEWAFTVRLEQDDDAARIPNNSR